VGVFLLRIDVAYYTYTGAVRILAESEKMQRAIIIITLSHITN